MVVVLAAVLAILFTPRFIQIHKLQTRSDNLTAELKKIQLENARLENELRLLREDPVYLEKVAREKFNKARQGEIIYKVVRQGQPAAKPDSD